MRLRSLLPALLLLAACAAPAEPAPEQDAAAPADAPLTYQSFSVDYPPTLAARESPDTQDGAGFRPAELPEDPGNEVITVGLYARPENHFATPFEEYVKIAAPQEIEGFQKLETIEPLVTDAGTTCYRTTWAVEGHEGPFVSNPIVYCPFLQDSTLQLVLEDEAYAEDFAAMARSVRGP